jgi:hypothetical protein
MAKKKSNQEYGFICKIYYYWMRNCCINSQALWSYRLLPQVVPIFGGLGYFIGFCVDIVIYNEYIVNFSDRKPEFSTVLCTKKSTEDPLWENLLEFNNNINIVNNLSISYGS